ncbi:biopolymer transporter ExbD [Pseudomonadales bacterium]|jgi:biopolymer transport protein ExbD|nr:biopolymer transporter ExbD [Pseudomonadales bacterium]
MKLNGQMALQFKRQKKAEIDINLTPLIDVVFLLLIFFMVSTSFIKESHLTLNLPQAINGLSSDAQRGGLEVIVDQNGAYHINDKSLVDTRSATLRSALKNLSQEDYSRPLTITADAAAPYQSIVRVIDVGGQLGFAQIDITTQDDDSE